MVAVAAAGSRLSFIRTSAQRVHGMTGSADLQILMFAYSILFLVVRKATGLMIHMPIVLVIRGVLYILQALQVLQVAGIPCPLMVVWSFC